MDIANDDITLPLPSALVKRQLARGVGFLVDDETNESDNEEMDVTQPVGGIIPPRDGVNRFLSGDDDQTMEFTSVYPGNVQAEEDDDTMGMEFTKVVGKIQGAPVPSLDKENFPPAISSMDDDDDGTPGNLLSNNSNNGHDPRNRLNPRLQKR
jgi:hypothetical protein